MSTVETFIQFFFFDVGQDEMMILFRNKRFMRRSCSMFDCFPVTNNVVIGFLIHNAKALGIRSVSLPCLVLIAPGWQSAFPEVDVVAGTVVPLMVPLLVSFPFQRPLTFLCQSLCRYVK